MYLIKIMILRLGLHVNVSHSIEYYSSLTALCNLLSLSLIINGTYSRSDIDSNTQADGITTVNFFNLIPPPTAF